MARTKCTARKQLIRRATPESIVREYRTYTRCWGDDLGEFLAHFYRLWRAAHAHGTMGYDGIVRLIRLLPSDWEGWASELAGDYIRTAEKSFDPEGDFPRFIAAIHYTYDAFGNAFRGPYMRPGNLAPVGVRPKERTPLMPTQAPITADPPISFQSVPSQLPVLGRRGRNDFEAGTSRPKAQKKKMPPQPLEAPPVQPSPPREENPIYSAAMEKLEEVLRQARELIDRGKALARTDNDEGEILRRALKTTQDNRNGNFLWTVP